MNRTIRGSSLVGTLVAVALLIGLVLFFLFRGYGMAGNGELSERKDHVGETIVGRSLARAKDEKCMEQIRQVRQALEILNPTGDEPVSDLSETRLGKSFLECPIGHEAYQYDTQTGKVRCPHPGHEKY